MGDGCRDAIYRVSFYRVSFFRPKGTRGYLCGWGYPPLFVRRSTFLPSPAKLFCKVTHPYTFVVAAIGVGSPTCVPSSFRQKARSAKLRGYPPPTKGKNARNNSTLNSKRYGFIFFLRINGGNGQKKNNNWEYNFSTGRILSILLV